MSRVIRTSEDLSGQTIDVSTFPDGHARESYLGQCDLRGATIIGDIRGSDLLRCPCEGLDLTQALIYGCQWTESTFDDATVFPDDAGAAQYEISYELVRRYIANRLPVRLRRKARSMLAAHQAGDWAAFCQRVANIMAVAADAEEARKLWQALPTRFRRRLREMFVDSCDGSPPRSTLSVWWPDGLTVEVDSDNLPPLSHPHDRYELKLWIQEQAELAAPGSNRYCVVHEITPDLRVSPLPAPDHWQVEKPNF